MVFESATRRLRRAAELIEGVKGEIELLERGGAMVERVADTQTGYYRWFSRLPADDLEEVALHLGEAVHGLHASLDHVMFELLGRPAGPVPAFPLCAEEDFDRLRSKTLGPVSDAQVAVLREVQPFAASPPPFKLVRKLDNIDKHRRLVVAAVLHNSNQATVVLEQPYEFNWSLVRGPIQDGLELGSVPLDGLPMPIDELGIEFGMSVVVDDPEIRDAVPQGNYLNPLPFALDCHACIEALIEDLASASTSKD